MNQCITEGFTFSALDKRLTKRVCKENDKIQLVHIGLHEPVYKCHKLSETVVPA